MYAVSIFIILIVLFVAFKTSFINKAVDMIFRKFYAWDMSRLEIKYKYLPVVFDAKSKLFSSLGGIVKKLNGPVLELGAGSGSNLEFYPKGMKLHTVDVNEEFRQYLEENLKKYDQVELEKYILCDASDMQIIPDATYSCVVSTFLLCCTDQQKTLREIYRVLKPGGRFYFMEHIIEKPGTFMRILQLLFRQIWKVIYSGCDITCDLPKLVQANKKFVNLNGYVCYQPVGWESSLCKRIYVGFIDKPYKS